MKILLKIFNRDRKTNAVLAFFSCYCLSLLLLRAKMTQSIYLFFLIWNLALAIIPYLITSYFSINYQILKNKYKTTAFLIIWLLFLPNSFYILTDIIHISKSKDSTIWYDLILIISFAVVGFFLGIKSLIAFEKISIRLFNSKTTQNIIPIICFLSGFGIYLGRILRHNSWEIVSNPIRLIDSIFTTLVSIEAIQFSINFGIFIYIIYIIKKNNTNL